MRCVLCKVSYGYSYGLGFFRFPTNERLRKKWMKFCGLESLQNEARLCSLHFDKKHIYYTPSGKTMRTQNSVPTIVVAEDKAKAIIKEMIEKFEVDADGCIVAKTVLDDEVDVDGVDGVNDDNDNNDDSLDIDDNDLDYEEVEIEICEVDPFQYSSKPSTYKTSDEQSSRLAQLEIERNEYKNKLAIMSDSAQAQTDRIAQLELTLERMNATAEEQINKLAQLEFESYEYRSTVEKLSARVEKYRSKCRQVHAKMRKLETGKISMNPERLRKFLKSDIEDMDSS